MKSLTDPAHKIDRQFDALAHYKKHGWSYPLSAEIDLTWRCALNCKGCHSKWLHSDKELNQVDIVHILGELKAHGCKSITYSGGGDPLESPHWKYAIQTAKIHGMDVGIYSYIPGIDQEKVDFLGKHCSFVYTHSCSTKGLKKPAGKCVWSYGYLLDSKNWHSIPDLVDKVDFDFFDNCDFRPLSPINAPDPPDIDYSWVERAVEILENVTATNPKVKATGYKFYDLLKADKGRDYKCCYSTDFTTAIGPDGECYECVNRRNITSLGNILEEGIEKIWARKNHVRTDMTGCRILCRNHQMNKTLWEKLGPSPLHENFV